MTHDRAVQGVEGFWRYGILAIALLYFAPALYGQPSRTISGVDISGTIAGSPITLKATVMNLPQFSRIELAYRRFGVSEFKRVEMQFIGGSALASIPAEDATAPYVEYYLILYPQAGEAVETYPEDNVELQPIKIMISGAEASQSITILSPNPGEQVPPPELLISFSLFRADSSIDRAATRVVVNGVDMTDKVVRSEDLYVLRPDPESMTAGNQTIAILLFDSAGTQIESSGWSFTLSGAAGVTGISPAKALWLSGGSIQLETRNESIAGSTTPFNRATLNAWSGDDRYRFVGRLYLTNEEKSYRQPQHRFFIGAESPWANLGYGDHNPTFTDLTMNGRRIRGVSGSVHLTGFNLDVSYGQILRSIEGDTLKTFPYDSLVVEQGQDPGATYKPYDDPLAPNRWAKITSGTFERNILVIRPRFGNPRTGQFGITYLKAKDDMSSIRFGVRPEENLVLGTDLLLGFDRRNIEIRGEVAFSATNRDITTGTFSNEDIDSIFTEPDYQASDRRTIRQIRDILGRFITVNENLTPLSFKNLATVSYEAGMALNYFNNLFRYTYLGRGANYVSFGQSYLRTDVVGYQLSDHLRIVDNQLGISFAFEHLKDNTAKSKATTTTFQTISTAVSYFSRSEFPNVSVGYAREDNSNDASDTTLLVDDQTDRFFIQAGRRFQWLARHDATLSFSISSRADNSLSNLDSKTLSVGFSATTYYSIPLQTQLSLSYTSNEFALGPASESVRRSYTTVYANAQYLVLQDKLRLFATVSPSFGDIQRVLTDAGARYFFTPSLSAQAQVTRYFNRGVKNDLIWSLILRLDV